MVTEYKSIHEEMGYPEGWAWNTHATEKDLEPDVRQFCPFCHAEFGAAHVCQNFIYNCEECHTQFNIEYKPGTDVYECCWCFAKHKAYY